tara:strand:- start:4361 stop:4849 length:489 start_codon:yes stop_codon:yes gene_type:complete
MADNKWKQPGNPPPPLFTGKKEKDLVKQVNDEVAEKVIGQTVLYYPISIEHTDYHPIYGEAIEKTFLNPIRVHALVEWQGFETQTTNLGVDRLSKITVHFHKRRLTEDQNLFVREGDFVLYGQNFYEIVTLNEPMQIFGQIDHLLEISAECVKSREGLFNAT